MYVCFPRADLSYQSYPLSARLRLRGHEQLNTGARFPFVGNIRRIESLYLKVYLLIAYLRDLIVESAYITSDCNNALDFIIIDTLLQLDLCTIIMNIIFIREIGI